MLTVMFTNEQKKVMVRQGESILQAAIKARVGLAHKCGGKGSCTTCKVTIQPDSLHKISAPSHFEQRLISEKQLQEGIRLGCQSRILQDIEVQLPEDPLKAIIRAQLEKQRKGIDDF